MIWKNTVNFIGCDAQYEEARVVIFGAPFDSTYLKEKLKMVEAPGGRRIRAVISLIRPRSTTSGCE